MSELLVICEFAEGCTSESCGYRQPTYGGTMNKAMCGHIAHAVDIIEYNEMAVSNPNYQFKRKKNGL